MLTDDQVGFERDRVDLRNFATSIATSCHLPALRLAASRCSLLVNQLLGRNRRSSTDASPSLASSSIATPSDITLPSPAASAPLSALEPLYGLQVRPQSQTHQLCQHTELFRFPLRTATSSSSLSRKRFPSWISYFRTFLSDHGRSCTTCRLSYCTGSTFTLSRSPESTSSQPSHFASSRRAEQTGDSYRFLPLARCLTDSFSIRRIRLGYAINSQTLSSFFAKLLF